MLFDLQGPRKTFVKVIYLGLAILLAGGLVLFGIGSDVNGGLADLFGGGAKGQLEGQVEDAEEQYEKRPKDPKALAALIGARYTLAADESNFNPETTEFTEQGKDQLTQAKKEWATYLKLTKNKPDATAANYAVQVFLGLQDAKGAMQAQEMITEKDPNAANYLALFLYASYAGDGLVQAGAKTRARELAEKDQLDEINKQIKQVEEEVGARNAEVNKQIQEQFAQQAGGGSGSVPGNPFGGAGAGAGPGTSSDAGAETHPDDGHTDDGH